MPSLVFSKYANQIQSLNVKITNGVKAPHKAIILITIINMIHKGKLTQNKILLENDIAEKFKECWNFYVDPNHVFSHFQLPTSRDVFGVRFLFRTGRSMKVGFDSAVNLL